MNRLQFVAPITLKAAKGKPRRFNILAYSGGLLNVDGFPLPVVVDLAGLDSPDSIPILVDHQNSVDSTLGHTEEITNTGRSILLAGPITTEPPQQGVPPTPAQASCREEGSQVAGVYRRAGGISARDSGRASRLGQWSIVSRAGHRGTA